MKKIITFMMIISSIIIFASINTNNFNIIKNIYQGKSITNIKPYPTNFKNQINYKNRSIYIIQNPLFIIGGQYITDWSNFERGLYLSDSLPYVNGITTGYHTEGINITSGVYFFSPNLTKQELLIQQNPAIDSNSDRAPLINTIYKNSGYSEPYKTYIIHSIEFNPWDFMRFSFSEINLVGGKFPDLVDINPLGILHNTYGEGYSNAMLAAELSLIPYKGFQIYAEYAQDDIVVGATEAGAEGYKPTAIAYAFGGRYVNKINDIYISPKIEYYTIYTWMYNRWQKLLKFTAEYDNIEIPMGFDYGNDMNGFLFGLDLYKENIEIKLTIENYNIGIINLDTNYNDERKKEKENWKIYSPIKNKTILGIKFSFEI
ncbi:hypothetical protein [Oceanotoga teriensis]|uniref:hypothetical protein n=1 Tax=Oceanotoga teriensis TaxID=515440 RepID=UPI002713B2A2|nr:hypothetical protein [Oceanotoga teriensis]MDO7975869.1 hypothetical protein [Oceanotoga teriensis]